jgi:hypothetical protein
VSTGQIDFADYALADEVLRIRLFDHTDKLVGVPAKP